MNDMEIIMTLGIFKGMQSQTNDPDVNHALGSAIDIFGKLLQGWEMKQPDPGERMDPEIDPNTGKIETIEEPKGGCTDEE